MKNFLSLILTVFFMALLMTGCTTHPGADARLKKYAPVPTEENCLLKWQGNTFKIHPNRQYAVFNRMPVQLPAAPRFGTDKIYTVTPMTLRNIIDPLMTGAVPARQIKTILIDPGHGGRDTGALGKSSREKDLNFLLAREISTALQRMGFKVFMTRTKDVFIPLKARPAMVKKCQADLFISVHHNASKTNPLAAGAECFAPKAPTPADTLLAYTVQHHLVTASGSVNRGIKFANFAVFRNNPVPAILIEAGFITNVSEERSLTDTKWRSRVAGAVADAVREYAQKAAAAR